jgi:uncharacterized protein YjbJ (UPF0337 family)
MNADILRGNWKQVKGMLKKNWGKLTEDEIKKMQGDYDNLVGKIQEKYGYQKEEARDKVDEFLKKIKNIH